ncbi:MAG TPA: hypothetical protein VH143_29650 [Kofleriaceae bacterium]|nr:hypothetical protein [Kofleriaceae bacterium]
MPPLSADVLASDEASPNTRVVAGEGYHFQIPAGFAPMKRGDGQLVYTGNIDGAVSPAPLTFWATATPFTGTLDALVKRETAAATTAGAKPPDVGPVMMSVGSEVKTGYAHRMTFEFPDHVELRTIAVHKGIAYILHCETPNVAAAWANAGTDCITRSTTFTIGAAPLPAPVAHEPTPETPNVILYASKIEAAHGWKKPTIKQWLEALVAEFMKPCFTKAPPDMVFSVVFDVQADGTAPHAKTTANNHDVESPAPADVASCVEAALVAHPLKASAAGTSRVTAIFQVRGDF